MPFKVIVEDGIEKALSKLPKEIQKRIWFKLMKCESDPFRYLDHFEGEGYKLRIGDYRALIDVDFKEKVLFVRMIDKRERIYR